MTSYKMDEDTGKLKRQTLPPVLPEECYVPIEGLRAWLERMDSRYVWCGRCLCVREAADYSDHLVIHKPGYQGGGEYARSEAVSA